ncbi:MAG: hypothetical protein RSD71_07990 [Flavobacterium sp.]
MKKIKKWLKKNEIYFTTICTLLLSGMAIIVSVISNQVANRQFDMEYFEKQPDFQITKEQLFNEKTQKYEDTNLTIAKLTGKAKNIDIETITILDIEYTNTKNEVKHSNILIEGYYETSFLSGKTEGAIQTETGYKNNSKEIELENHIIEMIENQNQFIYAQLKTYVQIRYLNFQNESKTEYFDASFASGKLINNDTLNKYFNYKT